MWRSALYCRAGAQDPKSHIGMQLSLMQAICGSANSVFSDALLQATHEPCTISAIVTAVVLIAAGSPAVRWARARSRASAGP